jgi:hypothetical protein
MSEDFMNIRGRHSDYDTAELTPLAGLPMDGASATADIVPFTEDIDLAEDPFGDDLGDQLAARAPRRYATRTTAVLAGLVLVAGGFLAGAQVQRNYGTSANGSSTGAGPAGLFAGGAANRTAGGGTGQGGTGGVGQQPGAALTGGTAAAAGVTTGTVKLVDGTTMYVQTADGNVVTVRTNGSTAVQIAQSGTLTDLGAGATVSVEGAAASDGTVTATKVTKGK